MVDRIVLDVELANTQPLRQSIGANERRESGIQAGSWFLFYWEQLAVPPHVPRSRLDGRAIDDLGDGLVVPGDLEGTQTLIANPECSGLEGGVADMAAEYEVHIV
jgi:hypothetical protein